jgi:hypothetical protein
MGSLQYIAGGGGPFLPFAAPRWGKQQEPVGYARGPITLEYSIGTMERRVRTRIQAAYIIVMGDYVVMEQYEIWFKRYLT